MSDCLVDDETTTAAAQLGADETTLASPTLESPFPSCDDKEKQTESGLPDAARVPIEDQEFPDGGRGWGVVFGAFLLTTCTFGLVSSWAVFQDLYENQVLTSSTPSAIAWIGSLQYSLILFPGLVSGRLLDIGYLHTPLVVGSTILVVATILVGECNKYWHFLITQGLVTGTASGFIFGPAMPLVSHWFKKRRATGIGCVAAGSAFGGTIFPIAVRNLLPAVERRWTMRILAFILLVFLTFANLLIKRRLPAKNLKGGLINPAAFKSIPYTIYTLGAFIGWLGMYTPLTYLDVSGVRQAHLTPNFSFYLVSIANASSIIGRIGGGMVSDKLGCLNMLVPFNVVVAACAFAWPFCTDMASIVVVAVVYGAGSGAFTGLLAAPVAYLGDLGDVGRRTGMMYTVVAIGSLVGPPISGAIYDHYGEYRQAGIYAGCAVLVCAALLFVVKVTALGTWRGRF